MKKMKYSLLLPLVALTSCGYSLEYIVPGNIYLSPVFVENYYDHWDKEFVNLVDNDPVDLGDENDGKFIKSIKDVAKVDKNLIVDNPYAELYEAAALDQYGLDMNLISYDSSFNYGVQSKLFDGETRCKSRYQRVRVQTRDTGFSVRFSKESDELTYFAFVFKAAVDYTKPAYQQYVGHHNSTITELHISIYTKEGLKIVNNEFVGHNIEIDGNSTNAEKYYFYAFDLTEYELSRAVGFSISYDYVDEKASQYELDYSLFIYEAFLPYTYWH